jgi:hypothetical protein
MDGLDRDLPVHRLVAAVIAVPIMV